MTPLARVIWSEGMHLAQHHFQMQSRYFEDSIAFKLSQLFFRTYGVAGCELDADALRNGTVSLIHARGVMPDGLAFHFPDGDPAPVAREIRDVFSPTQESHLVMLAIPPYRRGQSNCAVEPTDDGADLRYVVDESAVFDETTGHDEAKVTLGRKNFRLVLDVEPQDEFVTLPLARVRRDGAGHFIYDPDYVPPCLQIGASPRLMDILSRLVEILDAKGDALAGERQSGGMPLADLAAGEVVSFWLSHTIHAGLAPLRHHLQSRRAHPEQLFIDCSRLAGALCTFSLEAHPRTLPVYDHDDLGECFDRLDAHIRDHLQVTAPTNRVGIELKRLEKYPLLHTGVVADRRCLHSAQWYLGVRSDLSGPDVVANVKRLVKVCSKDGIASIVKEALRGLDLEHVPTPPGAISPRIGTQYFAVACKGPCWDSIVDTGEVGVYVPAPLSDAELHLQIVTES